MKKALLGFCICGILGVQAQIYINSNPPAKTTTTTTTTEKKAPVVNEVEKSAPSTGESSKEAMTAQQSSTGSSTITAKTGEDVPPSAEPGKCYARCVIEDKYQITEEKVVDQPKTIIKVKQPAVYKTVYDTVVVKPAGTKKYNVPAEYEVVREEVMVTPATTKWVKGKADEGCLSPNPADCEVMCLVEIPAVYKTVEKKVLKKEAYEAEEAIPMEYTLKARQVLVEEEKLVDEVTPATYKTVEKKVLLEKGGYQVWREVLCGDDLTSDKIMQIQQALKANGYNPGPLDNVFGAQTKAALMQYQKDKGLPVGNLNLETLASLGVK